MATTPAASDAKPAKTKGGGGGGKALLTILAATLGAAAGGFGAVIAAGSLGMGGGGTKHAETPAAKAVEYVELEQPLTSNLADTGRYLQVKLSVAQSGGAGVTAAIARHKPALVSAVLSVLGDAGEADVATREAKDRLRGRLRTAINETLKHNGVAGGVDEVFFTSLVVQ